MIENGKKVSIEYSVRLEDGTLVDSNVGKQPLVFVKGLNQILPALEEAISKLAIDDMTTVLLPPDKAYGSVNDEAFQEVDLESVPKQYHEPGAVLVVQDETGKEYWIKVHTVNDSSIVLDLNHPLAGKTLDFEIKIISVD